MGRSLLTRGLVVIVVLASGMASGCRRDDRPPPRPRRFFAARWTVVFDVKSSPTDSTLLLPFRPAADSDGVFLGDYYGSRILHFDQSGRLLWKFGREGRGPDEFEQIRDVKLDQKKRVWVLDQGNRRIVTLNHGGSVDRRISLSRLTRMPQGLIPLSNGDVLVLVDATDSPFVWIDAGGSIKGRIPLPWGRYRSMTYLAGQLTTAGQYATNDWVAGFLLGDGFFSFRETRPAAYRGWYAEHVDFPDVETVQTRSTREVRMSGRPVRAAQAITISPSRIYVLFAGSTPQARQIVDSYSLHDGKYLGSYHLPTKVDDLAWSPGGFYVVYNDPYPNLALLRAVGTELP